MNLITKLFAALCVLGTTSALVGCKSDEENPVTPDKMQQIRKKQDEDRAGFHPDMNAAPKAGG